MLFYINLFAAFPHLWSMKKIKDFEETPLLWKLPMPSHDSTPSSTSVCVLAPAMDRIVIYSFKWTRINLCRSVNALLSNLLPILCEIAKTPVFLYSPLLYRHKIIALINCNTKAIVPIFNHASTCIYYLYLFRV